MDHKQERELHKKKEREQENKEERKREEDQERQQAKGIRILHPGWLFILGTIFVALILLFWTLL